MPRWSEADLEARLCRALEIAKKAVNCFAVEGYADHERPAHSFGPEKPVAETAMLIYAASHARHRPGIGTRIDELARLLAPHARADRVLVDLALHPALALKFAVPHVLLTRLGYPDPAFDDLLRSCCSARARNGHDRPPSAAFERRWISSLWGRNEDKAGWRADLADSVVGWELDIAGGLRGDAYAFTHLIFYCTDFGFQPRRLPRRRSAILGEADGLLARYLDAEDYDLAGEILVASPLTGSTWTSSAAFGFRVLASVEDQAGLLPCGNLDPSRLLRLEGEERARYALGTAYHTALVMGFLCAAALRPGRAAPAKIVGSQCTPSCLSELLRHVDEDQGHWQPEFAALAEEERRILAPFVRDVAIHQKCRKHDYEAVRKVLGLAIEHGIAASPLCRQAAELLERLADCATAINRRHGRAEWKTERRDSSRAAALLDTPG